MLSNSYRCSNTNTHTHTHARACEHTQTRTRTHTHEFHLIFEPARDGIFARIGIHDKASCLSSCRAVCRSICLSVCSWFLSVPFESWNQCCSLLKGFAKRIFTWSIAFYHVTKFCLRVLIFFFWDASSHLFERPCPSIRPSVRLLVGWSYMWIRGSVMS